MKNSKIIVGVSGGADSVALIRILHTLGYECIITHCNFNLRANDSVNDELFTQSLAKELNLPYYSVQFNTVEFAKKNKISIELAARNLRYEWFEKLRIEQNASVIAVAHHADDNAETLLMNLTRGTGIKGLTAIPKKNGYVVRPLLDCTRNEIMGYLHQIGQNYVVDISNADNKYTRNKYRNEIIPILKQINPSFTKTISNSIKRFEEFEEIYVQLIESARKKTITADSKFTYINIKYLLSTTYSHSLLYEILIEYGFHSSTIESIYNSIKGSTGAEFRSYTHKLLIDRENIIICAINDTPVNTQEYYILENDSEIAFPLNISVTRRVNADNINKAKNTASFDAHKLKFPLKIRHWIKGDTFVPLGMNARKKLSDFFIDNKINRFEKENIWLLISGEDIIWIIGHRTNNIHKIDNHTTEVIEFNVL